MATDSHSAKQPTAVQYASHDALGVHYTQWPEQSHPSAIANTMIGLSNIKRCRRYAIMMKTRNRKYHFSLCPYKILCLLDVKCSG